MECLRTGIKAEGMTELITALQDEILTLRDPPPAIPKSITYSTKTLTPLECERILVLNEVTKMINNCTLYQLDRIKLILNAWEEHDKIVEKLEDKL